MHWRYRPRKQQLLTECQVIPEGFDGGPERLTEFARPFVACLARPGQRHHARTDLAGLASDLQRMNTESIAYRHDQERHGLRHFVGSSTWDHRPLPRESAGQVGQAIGTPTGHRLRPIGLPRGGGCAGGRAAAGARPAREGRYGQVGVFLAYATDHGHALVDVRLYLPKGWATDRARRTRCAIPKGVRYRTRPELARERLAETGPRRPHGGVTGDDPMGRSWRRRAERRRREGRYRRAMPSNTTVGDLEAEAPVWGGRGRPPKRAFEPARAWSGSRPPGAWRRIELGDGQRGPTVVDLVATPVVARTDRGRIGPEELLVVIRSRDEVGVTTHDDDLSDAPPETWPGVRARGARAGHRVEQCLQRDKSEAGRAGSQVRTWSGWHHHQALALMAAWLLVPEARRGKAAGAGVDGAAGACRARGAVAVSVAGVTNRSQSPATGSSGRGARPWRGSIAGRRASAWPR